MSDQQSSGTAGQPEASAEIPQRIGNYEVLRRIGSGPMGDVLMAKAGDSHHALKRPSAQHVRVSEHASAMLKRSIDVRLRPYLAIDYDEAKNRYVAMDYLEVQPASLASLDGMLSADAVEWMLSCCQALAALHKNEIVHGNLKPSNILVRRSKDTSIPGFVCGAMPIIGDIGLLYAYDADYFTGNTARGLFPYMAPEVIEAFVATGPEDQYPVAPTADVYAFGVSFIEIYSGHKVFDLPGELPTPERYLEEKRRRRHTIVERNDFKSRVRIDKLNEVVACCLDPDPKNRFASAEQLEKALQDTLVDNGNQ